MALLADITSTVTNTLNTVSDVTGGQKIGEWADHARAYLSSHANGFVTGTILLVIGIVVTGWIARGLNRALERRKLEPPERLLIIMVIRMLCIGLTVMIALDVFGYPVGAVVGGLGVLAVGAGFAMQGLLGNIIAGLTLIFTRPFRVGEYIEILNSQGLVIHIDILSTTLLQLDRSKVVIPNHKIVGEVLRNLGTVRQLVLNVGVAYDSDLQRARHLAGQVLARSIRVLNHPEPLITVNALKESSVNIAIKCWVKVGDYEAAEGELAEGLIDCYRKHRIEIPFPRRDVHLINPGTQHHAAHERIRDAQ